MTQRNAVVRFDGTSVGTLREQGRETVFTYDPAWLARKDAVPISLTLPLRAEPYVYDGLHPYFENLLPEGWLLELSTKKLKIPDRRPLSTPSRERAILATLTTFSVRA